MADRETYTPAPEEALAEIRQNAISFDSAMPTEGFAAALSDWLEAHDREVRREALLSAAESLRKRSDSLFKAGERMWAMSDYGRRDTFDCRTGERGLQACGWSGQMNRDAARLRREAEAL